MNPTEAEQNKARGPAERRTRLATSPVARLVAVIAGFVLIFVGIGMSVSIVLLPLGIPLGLAGLLMFLWGLMAARAARRSELEPERSPSQEDEQE